MRWKDLFGIRDNFHGAAVDNRHHLVRFAVKFWGTFPLRVDDLSEFVDVRIGFQVHDRLLFLFVLSLRLCGRFDLVSKVFEIVRDVCVFVIVVVVINVV